MRHLGEQRRSVTPLWSCLLPQVTTSLQPPQNTPSVCILAFSPFREGHIPTLQATVFYTDGTSATLTQDQLVWNVQSEHGLPGCTWNGVPVELCLLYDGIAPTDSVWLSQQGDVAARLRYMGVSVEFPIHLLPAHASIRDIFPDMTKAVISRDAGGTE